MMARLIPLAEGQTAEPSWLPWRPEMFTVTGRVQAGFFSTAVARYKFNADEHDGNEWRIHYAGPGSDLIEGRWFPTADEAKAAVEAHLNSIGGVL